MLHTNWFCIKWYISFYFTHRSQKVNKHQKLEAAQEEWHQYKGIKCLTICGDPCFIDLRVMNLEEKSRCMISKSQTPMATTVTVAIAVRLEVNDLNCPRRSNTGGGIWVSWLNLNKGRETWRIWDSFVFQKKWNLSTLLPRGLEWKATGNATEQARTNRSHWVRRVGVARRS